jgi:hypothetical protein
MGCDIHVMIEWAYADRPNAWSAVNFYGASRWDRNYQLFAYMAQVRGEYPDSFQARGLPSDASMGTHANTRFYVDTSGAMFTYGYTPHDRAVTPAKAEEWVKSGNSEYTPDKHHVTDPDQHSHSFLYLAELKQVRDKLEYPNVDLNAAIAMMEAYEAHGRITRVVFWFDN